MTLWISTFFFFTKERLQNHSYSSERDKIRFQSQGLHYREENNANWYREWSQDMPESLKKKKSERERESKRKWQMGGWNQVGCWELGLLLKRLQLLFLETVLTLLLLKIDGFPFFTFSKRVSVAVNASHLIKSILEKNVENWNEQNLESYRLSPWLITATYPSSNTCNVVFQWLKAPFHHFTNMSW